MEIEIKQVSYAYQVAGRLLPVLHNIDLKISQGEFWALVGAGGSGKSTLAQVIAGLLEPTKGQVFLNGKPCRGRGKHKDSSLWQRVGMVFQQPEQQLFAETVIEDVAFGPRNMGLAESEVDKRVHNALRTVGLDPEEIGNRSPFTISGGQQRRVAIAGVLAMDPEVLILDEPTAGLDQAGREQILAYINSFYRRPGKSIILISHNMEEVTNLARRVLVLHRGQVALQGAPREIFQQGDKLRAYGLIPPPITTLMLELSRLGAPVATDVLTVDEARTAIVQWLRSETGVN